MGAARRVSEPLQVERLDNGDRMLLRDLVIDLDVDLRLGDGTFEGWDNGAGVVIGSEIESSKCAEASRNLDEAGLSEFSEVREGDALDTLSQVPEPVDLVLLDGAKDLYLPVLRLLQPRLRAGAVVLADNIHTFRRSLRPYVEHVQSPGGGFVSTTLSMGHGFEYSVASTELS